MSFWFSVSQLNRAASRESTGSHNVKTTIEIADDLFERVQRIARKEKTTFRSLTEQGLRIVLREKQSKARKLPPLVTVPGELTDQYKNAPWAKLWALWTPCSRHRNCIYWQKAPAILRSSAKCRQRRSSKARASTTPGLPPCACSMASTNCGRLIATSRPFHNSRVAIR